MKDLKKEALSLIITKKTKLSGPEAIKCAKILVFTSRELERKKRANKGASSVLKSLLKDVSNGVSDADGDSLSYQAGRVGQSNLSESIAREGEGGDQSLLSYKDLTARLLTIGRWPKKVHEYILSRPEIDYSFLSEFTKRRFHRSDYLINAMLRKLDGKKSRKNNEKKEGSDLGQLRYLRLKDQQKIRDLRKENERLKKEIRELSYKDDLEALYSENRRLKDTLKSILAQSQRRQPAPAGSPSPDELYLIEQIRSKYGVRPKIHSNQNLLIIDAVSKDGLSSFIEKLL